MKKTTFAAFGAFALLAASATAHAADTPLWETLSTGAQPAAVKAAPVASSSAAVYSTKGELIEFTGGQTPVVIEIREAPKAVQQPAPVAAAAVAHEVQDKVQEIAAATDEVVDEPVIEEIAVQEQAPVVKEAPKRITLWDQLTGKHKKAVDIEADGAVEAVKSAEAYVAPVVDTPAVIETQGAVAQEAQIELWEKLAVEKPVVR